MESAVATSNTYWEDFEIAVLLSKKQSVFHPTPPPPPESSNLFATVLTIGEKVIDGQYLEVFSVPLVKTCLVEINKKYQIGDEDPFKHITLFFEDFIFENPSEKKERQIVVLLIGIAFLRVFVQSNWTGPSIKLDGFELFKDFKGDLLELLETDGEPSYKYLSNPQFLLMAISILCELTSLLDLTVSGTYWAFLCSFYHQKVMMGPSEKLRKLSETAIEKAEYIFPPEKSRDIATMIALEHGLLYNFYHDSSRASSYLLKSKEISGLETQLTGAMGRRTKFQTFDVPQLLLFAKSKDETISETNSVVPETVESPDPDAPMLNQTKFTETNAVTQQSNLSVIDQAIILALCLDVKNRNPRHGLTWEEMRVYVERTLQNSNNWMVHSMGLLLKARLEFQDQKYMDKASLQIEVLVNQFDSDLEKDYHAAIRMKYIDLLAFPPRVLLKKELAQKWMAIGSAASAQLLFEELEMWEEIAECYILREMKNEAEEFLNKRLAIAPTPRLWATLGDITGETKYYVNAWTLSKGRFTRAKRSLGKIAMHKQQFEEAIKHFEEALAINPQHGDAWFRLGCCCLAVNNYGGAQQAFGRVVQLHPDDGESWNNLASVHIKKGKMREAFVSLKEAVRFKSESWQIWENLLIVSMDLGEFTEAIVVLDKLLDLRDKQIDTKILFLLQKFIVDEIQSGKSVPGNFLHKAFDALLQKITTKISDNAELWDICATYWMALGNPEEAVKQRHKQCRALLIPGWEDTAPLFRRVVDACEKLTHDQLVQNGPKQLHSTRLFLVSVMKKTADSFEGTPEHNKVQEMIVKITDAENKHSTTKLNIKVQ